MIGKGRVVIKKVFSIVNVGISASKLWWKDHNSSLFNIAKEVANDDMTEAGNEVYCCFLSNTVQTGLISAGFSYDYSFKSTRGWQGKEVLVAAIIGDTGKIVDIVHKSQLYLQCKKMKEKCEKGSYWDLKLSYGAIRVGKQFAEGLNCLSVC